MKRELGVDPIITFVEKNHLRWCGHRVRVDVGTEREETGAKTQETMEKWQQKNNRKKMNEQEDDRR